MLVVEANAAALHELDDLGAAQRLVDLQEVVVARRHETAHAGPAQALLGELDPAPHALDDDGAEGAVAAGLVLEGEQLVALADDRVLTAVTNPLLEPNQTISTGSSRRISNVAMTQVTYKAGRRSSISATAAYGTLNFLGSGFINSNNWLFLGGYHFYLSRIDTLSIAYVHSFTRFDIRSRALPSASGESLGRGVLLSYGRSLTGRLSLQLSGGPTFTEFAQPQGRIAKSTRLSTYDSLVYEFRTSGVNLSFVRNSTGGSGVLFGAESNVVRLGLDRQVSRSFSGNLEVGHAFNQSLGRTVQAGQSAGTTQSSRTGQRSKFETWEAGVSLSRRLMENTSLFVNYHLEIQSAIIPTCFVSNCGETLLRHVGGIGINWSARPIKLD